MVHYGCDFVACIHQSRTWMSGSFESLRWNACVHRLDLSLYSHPKEFLGIVVRTQQKNSALPKTFSSEEDRTRDAASSRTASPTHYRAIPAPTVGLIRCIPMCNVDTVCCSMAPNLREGLLMFLLAGMSGWGWWVFPSIDCSFWFPNFHFYRYCEIWE